MLQALKTPRSLVVALLAALALTAASLAPDAALAGPPPGPPAPVPIAENKVVTITKKLVGPTSEMRDSERFEFNFEKLSMNGGTSLNDLASMPSISGRAIDIGLDQGDHSSKKVEGPTTTLRRDLEIKLTEIGFVHAGVYKYTAREVGVTNTGQGTIPGLQMSQASYTLTVYVKNKPAGGVEVDKATVEQDKDDDGAQGTGKVEPNPNPANPGQPDTPDNPGTDVDGGSGFLFVNKIVPGAAKFTLKKTVAGDYGDHSRDFDLTLTLAVPSTAAPAPAAGYTGTVRTVGTVVTTTNYTFVPGTPTPFKLRHDQELVFEDLPSGSELTYTETGVSGYTPSSSTVVGTAAAVTQQAAEGQNFTLDKIFLARSPNSSELTNTYKTVTPTGIAVGILPYVVMVAVPVLAAVAHLAHRRRMAQGA